MFQTKVQMVKKLQTSLDRDLFFKMLSDLIFQNQPNPRFEKVLKDDRMPIYIWKWYDSLFYLNQQNTLNNVFVLRNSKISKNQNRFWLLIMSESDAQKGREGFEKRKKKIMSENLSNRNMMETSQTLKFVQGKFNATQSSIWLITSILTL